MEDLEEHSSGSSDIVNRRMTFQTPVAGREKRLAAVIHAVRLELMAIAQESACDTEYSLDGLGRGGWGQFDASVRAEAKKRASHSFIKDTFKEDAVEKSVKLKPLTIADIKVEHSSFFEEDVDGAEVTTYRKSAEDLRDFGNMGEFSDSDEVTLPISLKDESGADDEDEDDDDDDDDDDVRGNIMSPKNPQRWSLSIEEEVEETKFQQEWKQKKDNMVAKTRPGMKVPINESSKLRRIPGGTRSPAATIPIMSDTDCESDSFLGKPEIHKRKITTVVPNNECQKSAGMSKLIPLLPKVPATLVSPIASFPKLVKTAALIPLTNFMSNLTITDKLVPLLPPGSATALPAIITGTPRRRHADNTTGLRQTQPRRNRRLGLRI